MNPVLADLLSRLYGNALAPEHLADLPTDAVTETVLVSWRRPESC